MYIYKDLISFFYRFSRWGRFKGLRLEAYLPWRFWKRYLVSPRAQWALHEPLSLVASRPSVCLHVSPLDQVLCSLLWFVFRQRSCVTPKTRPIRGQSGRSWRRWDTRSWWTCCTPSRREGSSTSYWSAWVVSEELSVEASFSRLHASTPCYACTCSDPALPSVLFSTRRGAVHAAREGRHLHGGHCLVRTHTVKKTLETQHLLFVFLKVSLLTLILSIFHVHYRICSFSLVDKVRLIKLHVNDAFVPYTVIYS